MRFSVDAHAIGRHLTGNEVYVRNLLDSFAALDDSSEFIAYHSVPEAAYHIPRRFRRRTVAGNPFLRLGYDLAAKLRQDKPDLVHVQYTAPIGCPVPIVVSVHDVSFLEHPEYFPIARALQLRLTVRETVKRAAKILTPSEFSRQAIVNAYGLDDRKISVVPNAVSREFRPRSQEAAAKRISARFNIPSPFILTVGDLQPRKNQRGLIRAFEDLLRHHPGLPHHLVLVGQDSWYGPRIRRSARRALCAERIHFTDFVSDEDLIDFYAACDLFAFPSLYEGFGLPILEAMACGRAVTCSNTTAIPEVADAAAILFDPESVEAMTRALRDLLLNPELRQGAERRGQKRAAKYTWRNTAEMTLAAYHEVAGRTRPVESYKVESVPVSHS